MRTSTSSSVESQAIGIKNVTSRPGRRPDRLPGLLLGLLSLLAIAFASNATAAEHHSLWAVTGNHNTVYLLGSVHLLKSEEQLPAVMEAAYQDAKALVMEIDLDDIDPMSVQAATMKLGMLPEGKTLQQQIGPAAAAKLSAYTQKLGIDAAMFSSFRPWLVAITLSQLQLMKMGLDPQAGVEQRFMAKAVADHKDISGLETLDEQLGYFAKLSTEQETKYLAYTIDDATKAEKEFGDIMTAWRSGNAKALARTMDEGFDEFPELYSRLTVERNRRWVAPVEQLLRGNQNYLVIVGAFHLVGKDGLVELLERRGYKVTQQ